MKNNDEKKKIYKDQVNPLDINQIGLGGYEEEGEKDESNNDEGENFDEDEESKENEEDIRGDDEDEYENDEDEEAYRDYLEQDKANEYNAIIDERRKSEEEKEERMKEENDGDKAEDDNPYLKWQKILDKVKLFTGATSTFGAAPIFIIVAHGEWLFSILVPEYKIPWWKKALVVLMDLVIIFVFLLFIFAVQESMGWFTKTTFKIINW